MKKLIFAVCIVAATSSVYAQKKAAVVNKTKANTEAAPAVVDKAAHKAKIIDLLKSQIPTENANEEQKKSFNGFFDCASDALVNNLSEEDLTSFENITNLPEDQQQAIGTKVAPYLQPCAETLQKSLTGGAAGEDSSTPPAPAQ